MKSKLRQILKLFTMFSLVTLVGCADVPQEAVTLSMAVGDDLEVLHRSHRALAESQFKRMTGDINAFIDETYGPFIVKRSLTKKREVTLSDNSKIKVSSMDIIIAEAKKPGAGKSIEHMQKIVDTIMVQINKKRTEYLVPIKQQESDVLGAIDNTYSKVKNAQAIVTEHLSSVQEVQSAQQEILESVVDLKDISRKFIDATATLSNDIADLTTKARRKGEDIDSASNKITGLIEQTRQKFEDLKAIENN